MEGLLCDLLWADPSDDPGVTNIESLSDQVKKSKSYAYCIVRVESRVKNEEKTGPSKGKALAVQRGILRGEMAQTRDDYSVAVFVALCCSDLVHRYLYFCLASSGRSVRVNN